MEGRDGVHAEHIAAARLVAQQLRAAELGDVAAAVRWFGAVQGQEFHPALWGVTRRLAPPARPGAAGAVAAFDRGELLRTHLLRPTWHLVAPGDARWLLELTAPRVHRANGTMYRSLGTAEHVRETELVLEAVGGGPRTRRELDGILAANGRPLGGIALGYVLMRAELDRLLVSGPMRGRQQTYAAFDERVPPGYGPLGDRFDRDAALVELLRRYLRSRAYATVKDASQWSGLTLAELRHGLGLLGDEVVCVPGAGRFEGLEFWRLADPGARVLEPGRFLPAPGAEPVVDLLQSYDELIMSYGESRGAVAAPGVDLGERLGSFIHGVAVDGVFVGRWRWVLGPRDLAVETQWRREPTAAELAAFDVAAAQLAEHWAVPLRRAS